MRRTSWCGQVIGAEGQAKVGPVEHRRAEAVGAADGEDEVGDAVVAPAGDPFGEGAAVEACRVSSRATSRRRRAGRRGCAAASWSLRAAAEPARLSANSRTASDRPSCGRPCRRGRGSARRAPAPDRPSAGRPRRWSSCIRRSPAGRQPAGASDRGRARSGGRPATSSRDCRRCGLPAGRRAR